MPIIMQMALPSFPAQQAERWHGWDQDAIARALQRGIGRQPFLQELEEEMNKAKEELETWRR